MVLNELSVSGHIKLEHCIAVGNLRDELEGLFPIVQRLPYALRAVCCHWYCTQASQYCCLASEFSVQRPAA